MQGQLDRGALRRALDRIVARHEALRTRSLLSTGEPTQRIAAAEESRFQLLEHDLVGTPDAQTNSNSWSREEATTGFDLEAGPLIRGRLIRLGEEEHALLITMHHIVSDGWSMGVLIRELSALYGAYARGEADPLPDLSVQYADYAVWQRKVDGRGDCCESRESTGSGRWRERRRCWSCRRIMRDRRSRIMPAAGNR